MFKKSAKLLLVLAILFSFNSITAKEEGQDGTCQGHPFCEKGDNGSN